MFSCAPLCRPLQDCISLGSGEPNVPEHRSFVLYHNNSPRWSEVIKLPIPIDRFRGSHLRFEFRHCSSESQQQGALFQSHFVPLDRSFAAGSGHLLLTFDVTVEQCPLVDLLCNNSANRKVSMQIVLF